MTAASNDGTTALLDRARRGDRAALAELLENHAQRLLETVRAELGNRARQRLESQDVMQEVFLDAVRTIDRFEQQGSASFFHWLRRIAINRICDVDRRHFKTKRRGPEVRVGDLSGGTSAEKLFSLVSGRQPTPSGVVRGQEQTRQLQQALAALARDHRTVLGYRYLQQLSVAETAAKMDRSEQAVRALCVRALMQLREQLRDVL